MASQELITERMERGAECILQLLQAGKQEEALALMSMETWGLEETKGA